MDRQRVIELLEMVKQGGVSVADAASALQTEPFADLDFAKVDLHRHIRCGFPEVIYSEGKTPTQLVAIFERIAHSGAIALATRLSEPQAAVLRERFPTGEYDPLGRTFWSGNLSQEKNGKVFILTAGTSDLPVAQEAFTTARVMGSDVQLIADVGVAGLHRLLAHHSRLTEADCLVVVAGMEGALPSVVGGLVDCPVVAVPTSVGYGANFAGLSALLGMLSSCAANVTVVNIDGGFCGGYVAALIARNKVRR